MVENPPLVWGFDQWSRPARAAGALSNRLQYFAIVVRRDVAAARRQRPGRDL